MSKRLLNYGVLVFKKCYANSTESLLCGRESLSTFIHSCFNQGQNLLCNQFQKIKSKLSLTSNVWTSPSNLLVLGAIALGAKLVKGNHSGIFCITANNASNNGKMATHLATLIPFNPSQCMLGCMAHVYQSSHTIWNSRFF
ncbi:uncharacterized protein VP01_367g3 [Puccinia sorghi]|uniref:Uncharacterized protein n=1 Tax=Puccinia sorghi TaxID=27349 RepID=A0A0L6UUB7_9BASI|nr:uncharacterized protein VP01_367g3 [Puccinia sorghi]